MARVVAPEPKTEVEEAIEASREYLAAKAEETRLTARIKVLRAIMFEKLEKVGERDSDGHYRFRFPEAINGSAGLVKQRRVSRSVDEAKALEIIRAKDLGDTLIKTVEVVDEDAIMQALMNDLLTEEEVDLMYPVKESFALTTEKAK